MIHNDSDIPKDEWDHIEDTLQKSKYYLHEGRKPCYVEWEYTKNKAEMEEMGLPDNTPQDIIYPVEDIFYDYFWTQKLSKLYHLCLADIVKSHREIYEKFRWEKSKSKEEEL